VAERKGRWKLRALKDRRGVWGLKGTHVSSLAEVGEGVGEVGDEEGEAEIGRRAVDEVEAVGKRPEGDGEVYCRRVDGMTGR